MTTSTLDHHPIDDLSFVVLDFETITHAGHPPEPVELGALRILPGGTLDPAFVVDWRIQPPPHTPMTVERAGKMGLRAEAFVDQPTIQDALQHFEQLLGNRSHILVAHNAPYDASFIVRYADACPSVAQLPFIDSVRLARHLLPQSRKHGLDALAIHFDLPLPIDRHRALPDVKLTCEIFLRLLAQWRETYSDQRFFQLRQVAGIQTEPPPTQASLFG